MCYLYLLRKEVIFSPSGPSILLLRRYKIGIPNIVIRLPHIPYGTNTGEFTLFYYIPNKYIRLPHIPYGDLIL